MKWRGDPKKHYVYETECWGPPRGSVLIELGLGLWGGPTTQVLGKNVGEPDLQFSVLLGQQSELYHPSKTETEFSVKSNISNGQSR